MCISKYGSHLYVIIYAHLYNLYLKNIFTVKNKNMLCDYKLYLCADTNKYIFLDKSYLEVSFIIYRYFHMIKNNSYSNYHTHQRKTQPVSDLKEVPPHFYTFGRSIFEFDNSFLPRFVRIVADIINNLIV